MVHALCNGMNCLRWFVMMLMFLLCVDGHAAGDVQNYMNGFTDEDGHALSQSFHLDGVAGFIEGRASTELMIGISKKSHDWISGAMIDVASEWRYEIRGRGEYKDRVQAALKKRIKEWLPGQVKKIIRQGIAGELPGGEVTKQTAEIADRVWGKWIVASMVISTS